MGMDVIGRAPKNKTGEYFRNNVWWWRPLADLCLELAPEICSACKYWHSNDGGGLNARQAEKLGKVLNEKIKDGTVEGYIRDRDKYAKGLPDEKCTACDGTV